MIENKCQKTRFDRIGAMWAVAQAINSGDSDRRERRYYWCAECQAYHLTSRPDRRRIKY